MKCFAPYTVPVGPKKGSFEYSPYGRKSVDRIAPQSMSKICHL